MDLKILSDTAAALFAEYRLAGWTFGLAASKRRLGVCKYRRKRIEIGEFYARHNPDAAVLDTLLHEIAHALAGPKAGHGPVWQAIAARIGATPRACDDSPDTVVEPGDWQTTPARRANAPTIGTNAPARCPAIAASARPDPRSCSPTPATRPASRRCPPWQNRHPPGGTRAVPAAAPFTGVLDDRRRACGGAGVPPGAS
jgi:hypothetical protein